METPVALHDYVYQRERHRKSARGGSLIELENKDAFLGRYRGWDGLERYRCISLSFARPDFGRYILKPRGSGPFPAVIVNHGGHRTSEDVFATCALFAHNGFVTIACNLRHGEVPLPYDWIDREETWEEGMGPGTSEENIRRLQESIEILKSLEYVDSKKIAIYGHSMGGHLTVGYLALANKNKDVRVGAITSAGIYPKNPEEFKNSKWLEIIKMISPEAEAIRNIEVPFLIIHGRRDRTCPVECAMTLKEELDKHDRVSILKIHDDEGHGVNHRQGVFEEIIRFYRKHLSLPESPIKKPD